MHPYLNISVKIARLVGKMLIDAMLHVNIATAKKNLSTCEQLTTNLEKSLTEAAVNVILKAYPSHNIHTKFIKHDNNSLITWLIDPLNGQLNFWYGIPLFSISIAILHEENIEHGVIYNPISDELFVATKGNGARLNNKRLRVATNQKLSDSLLAIDSDLLCNRSGKYIHNLELLPINNQKIINRDLGSAALNLAFIANGRLDGYCDHDLHFCEIAAGVLIVKESGGYVSEISMHRELGTISNIIAGNPKIYPELIRWIGNYRS